MTKKISVFAVSVVLLFAVYGIAGDFTDNSDGTVTDENTGLMWQRGEAGSMNWEDAISYCEGLSLAGYTDWRLPNIKELRSIVDNRRYDPAMDDAFFLDIDDGGDSFWSSTNGTTTPEADAWCVIFRTGDVDWPTGKGLPSYVRCVRRI